MKRLVVPALLFVLAYRYISFLWFITIVLVNTTFWFFLDFSPFSLCWAENRTRKPILQQSVQLTMPLTPQLHLKPSIYHIIHLGSSVCHPVCRPVIVAERWAILFVLVSKLTKETRRRVWRGRDSRWRDRRWKDWRGRVWIDFSLFIPNIIKRNVHSATCSCSVELYKQWYTLADFLPNWNFRGVFFK